MKVTIQYDGFFTYPHYLLSTWPRDLIRFWNPFWFLIKKNMDNLWNSDILWKNYGNKQKNMDI